MFLLALCLFGTALAAPAIREAPSLPAEADVLVSPYIAYSAPIFPLKTLEMNFELAPKEEIAELPEPEEEFSEPELEPKEENAELPEPEEEFSEPELPEEPKEALPEPPAAPELPIPEAPKPIEPVVIKLEVPKPPRFISNWWSSLPNFSLPSFIGDWFRPTSNPSKLIYPAYYTAYPGAVIVEAPKL